MSKSIKLKDNKYWDSSSIMHNRELLSTKVINSSGSNSNGNWIKFEDGTMITYQEIEVEMACNTAWGNLFVGNYATAINFPQTFKELPKVLIDLKLKVGACFKVEWEIPIITTSSYKNIGIGRGSSSNAVGLTITLYAIGKWK